MRIPNNNQSINPLNPLIRTLKPNLKNYSLIAKGITQRDEEDIVDK
ncbi:unnamed protein product [Arabidopsis halleri]